MASPFIITGEVVLGTGGNQTVPGIEVSAITEDGSLEGVGLTDENGVYSITFDIEDGVVVSFLVHIFDWCTGDILSEVVSNENADNAEVNFMLCSNIEVPDCHASFTHTEPASLTINFVDNSQPADEITSWLWDFGDGTTSTEQNPEHTFPENGQYAVTLTITTDSCENYVQRWLWINDFWGGSECGLQFQTFENGDNELDLTFEPLAQGEIIAIHWDFGDGHTSEDISPTHVYEVPGLYEIEVSYTLDIEGDTCMATITQHICPGFDLENQECPAAFEYEISNDDENGPTVLFTDTSNEAVSWSWNLETVILVKNKIHTYL